jgi:hypothetical protein
VWASQQTACSAPSRFALRNFADPAGEERRTMGKYVLGWLLGVPVFVLVIVYVLFN